MAGTARAASMELERCMLALESIIDVKTEKRLTVKQQATKQPTHTCVSLLHTDDSKKVEFNSEVLPGTIEACHLFPFLMTSDNMTFDFTRNSSTKLFTGVA